MPDANPPKSMRDERNTVHGLSPADIIEREAGGRESKAFGLCELQGNVEWAIAEWEYDTEAPEAVELVRLARDLSDYLSVLSITAEGALTHFRECIRCSGDGKTSGEDPCIECGGRGAVHADEADG
jgi:hypothetical protein